MSAPARHRRGVRSIVQATIERISTTRPTLNHVELNTWNSWSCSSALTTPTPSTGSYVWWSLSISFA